MNKRMIIMLVACALVFGAIFGFKWFINQQMSAYFDKMGEGQVVTVSAAEARGDTWGLSLGAVGSLEAINGVAVTTEAAGVVESIHFESGERAEAGEVLVRLNDVADQARLRSLQARAAEADSGFRRASRLYDEGNLSESERDLARSKMVQARAEAAAQREVVEQKTIRAPFAGELGIRKIDIGQYVSPGTSMVTLQQIDPIHVNFSLPEQHINRVEKGMEVDLSLSAWPQETFTGKIVALEPGADENTRNFGLQARLVNSERKLRPGMFARVKVRLPESEDVVVVPRTAISFNPYGNSVYVITPREGEQAEGKEESLMVKRRFVKTGRVRGTMIAVTQGLEPGERVASSGLLKLRNNASVKINNEGAPPEDESPEPENR